MNEKLPILQIRVTHLQNKRGHPRITPVRCGAPHTPHTILLNSFLSRQPSTETPLPEFLENLTILGLVPH